MPIARLNVIAGLGERGERKPRPRRRDPMKNCGAGAGKMRAAATAAVQRGYGPGGGGGSLLAPGLGFGATFEKVQLRVPVAAFGVRTQLPSAPDELSVT